MIIKLILLSINFISSFYLMKIVDQVTLTTNLQKCFIYIYFSIIIYLLHYLFSKYIMAFINKKDLKKIIIISTICSIFVIFYKNIDLIPTETFITKISITTSTEKNADSNGKEVWILGININGKPIKLKDLDINGFNIKEDVLVAVADNEAGICNIYTNSNNNVDIKFGMHAWSGIVQIVSTNNSKKIDLFDEKESQFIYNIDPIIKEHSLQYIIFMLVISYIVITYCVFFLLSFIYLKLFRRDIKCFLTKVIIILLQFVVLTLYYEYYGKLYFTFQLYIFLLVVILGTSLVMINKSTIPSLISNEKNKRVSIVLLLSLYWGGVIFGKSLFNDLNIGLRTVSLYLLLSIALIPSSIALFKLIDEFRFKVTSGEVNRKRFNIIIFAILFIFLIFASYAFYPGIMTSDGIDQWIQAIGKTPIYDAHTPTHTLMIRLCSYIWKNPYIVVIVQIFSFSLVIERILTYFINKGLPIKLGYIIAFFIAISPNNIVMTSLISKNIAFTIIFLWVLYQLMILLQDKDAFMYTKSKVITFAFSLALLQLVRKNTFFAVYYIFVFLIIIAIKNYKTLKWRPLAIIVICILVVKFIEGPVYRHYKVEGNVDVSSGIKEPCYMAIGAILNNNLAISESDKEKLRKVLDLNLWKSRYNSYNYDIFSWSDPIPNKGILSNSEVLGVSLRLFKEYPLVMIKSRLDATDIIWNVVKPPYVDVSRYSIGLLIPEPLQRYVPELAKGEIYKGNDLFFNENKLTPYIVKYVDKSISNSITDLLFWRVGIYFGLSITIWLYSLYKKKDKLFIISSFGLSMMLSLLIALGWQIYQYVWFYNVFSIMLLLYIMVYDSKAANKCK